MHYKMRKDTEQILQKEDLIIRTQTTELRLLLATLIVAAIHAIMYIPSFIYYVKELLK